MPPFTGGGILDWPWRLFVVGTKSVIRGKQEMLSTGEPLLKIMFHFEKMGGGSTFIVTTLVSLIDLHHNLISCGTITCDKIGPTS